MSARCIIGTMATTSDGSDEVTLLFPPQSPDLMICWNWIMAMNRDSRGSSTQIILQRASQVYSFTKARQTNADRSVHVSPGVKAPGDFQPGAIFAASSSGDKLEICVFGEIVA